MSDFTIRQGDIAPVFTYTLDGAPNVTGHTIKFVMRAMTAVDVTINAAATLVTPASGGVSYTFTAQDAATAGLYQAYFLDVTSGQTYPPAPGILEIEVSENLTTQGGARLVGLGEVKEHLRITSSDRVRDAELIRFIDDIAPVVEGITGPILQRVYQNELYDGGGTVIELLHRPVIAVETVVEYRGPIPYNLQQVSTPDLGTIYSYTFDPHRGRIVRRTSGGGIQTFPGGKDQVWVTYTAGFAKTPGNVRRGTLELIRVNYQQTQQGRPKAGNVGALDSEEPGHLIMGFFVPNRVRELLGPNKRFPSIA